MSFGHNLFTVIILTLVALSIGDQLSHDVLVLKREIKQVKDDMEALKRENAILKSLVMNETPGFTVYSSSVQSLATGDVITFSGEITNNNGDFNVTLGRFTCGYNGLYFFSLNLRSDVNVLDAALMVNDNEILAIRIRDVFHSESNSLLTLCNQGDTVHVEATGAGSIYGATEGLLRASTFSGFLVQLITV